MPVGQVLQIPSGTQVQYRVPSGYEARSIAVLNPNNGTVYIARNRPAVGSQVAGWDYKVPSQSYAMLPGPYIEAGVWYTDNSGSGAPGEITIYDLTQKLAIPNFQAIGIAVLSAGTSVDITQGAQPANPPANTSRLWVDTSNHLHILNSTGTSFTVIDDNTALGGVLTGTLPNPQHANIVHVFPQNIVTGGSIAVGGSPGLIYASAANNDLYLRANTASQSVRFDTGDVRISQQLILDRNPPIIIATQGSALYIRAASSSWPIVMDTMSQLTVSAPVVFGSSSLANGAIYTDWFYPNWGVIANGAGKDLFIRAGDSTRSVVLGPAGYPTLNAEGTGISAIFTPDRNLQPNNTISVFPNPISSGVQTGLYWLIDSYNGPTALFLLRATAGATLIAQSPSGSFSTVFGTPNALNVGWSGTIQSGGGFAIESKLGYGANVRSFYIGRVS